VTLAQIAVLTGLAVLLGRLRGGRGLALLGVSAVILFWLQPVEPLRTLGFWVPVATLGLTVVTWLFTQDPERRRWSENWPAAAVLVAVVGLAVLAGSVDAPLGLTFVRPGIPLALTGLMVMCGTIAVLWRLEANRNWLLAVLATSIVLAFVVIKTPRLEQGVVTFLQDARPSGEDLAGIPFTWLGFSYMAFRLLHTIRDRQSGRLPPVGLSEFVNYVIFFPAYTAGPIDRVERFVKDLRAPVSLSNDDWLAAGSRIVLGLFKKLVIADVLAVISVSDLLVDYVRSPGWMWLLVYAYALRIYFDFSGYTDMAVGMGRLLGVKLPENFNAPYLKQNIALFWNAWHMSLTQWFRAYVFNPLTRLLRSGRRAPPTWLAILLTQVVTMVLIGLWHGFTVGYALWGLWHGLGLFLHNRWVELTREWWSRHGSSVVVRRVSAIAGGLLTFHFVAVGWLFFGLSSPVLAWKAVRILFGAI
jgi:D-alanyl-lipoteichoic acid acyltransferase DltB (MBOAT superfamily)